MPRNTPAYDESLVAYLRGLSVAERLALNDASVNAANELRVAMKKAVKQPPPSG